MQDVISMRDFSKEEILHTLEVAGDIKRAIHEPSDASFPKKYGRELSKILDNHPNQNKEHVEKTISDNSIGYYNTYLEMLEKNYSKKELFNIVSCNSTIFIYEQRDGVSNDKIDSDWLFVWEELTVRSPGDSQ